MLTFEVCLNYKKDENICLLEIFIKIDLGLALTS